MDNTISSVSLAMIFLTIARLFMQADTDSTDRRKCQSKLVGAERLPVPLWNSERRNGKPFRSELASESKTSGSLATTSPGALQQPQHRPFFRAQSNLGTTR